MASLIDRDSELMAEAEKLGLLDRVHQPDMRARIQAYADVLGYDLFRAIDPDVPLKRIQSPEKVYAYQAPERSGGKGPELPTTRIPWPIIDQLLIEITAEMDGVEFESKIAYTPEIEELKTIFVEEIKRKEAAYGGEMEIRFID